ncbi:sialate O-acetylesterase [Mucilaginibacter corticis]|uniref:Sialate O-acetylesterase n=1 Tax=Mucilaginibacter corticis TaxID=2597670 RepID=A0A556MTF7_9SPHI|nr:sialate O-acetylesterase [Mucilaginibacter corticis]TSJ43220.1 sialate O-acetylesterase [Mucilaginibacter corticis]
MRRIFLLVSFCFICLAAVADVKLPAIITDNMVLQQKSKVALWGWADAGENISITGSWNGKKVSAVTGADGKWQLWLKTGNAGGPYTISVQGKNHIDIKNVLLGEVWLASGQSNMQFTLGSYHDWRTGVNNYEAEVAKADNPKIHMFQIPQNIAQTPQQDLIGVWKTCIPANSYEFSAVAYYFAREVSQATGYPVGIINSSWGGTPAESWVSRDVLQSYPNLKTELIDTYDKEASEYPAKIEQYKKDLVKWKLDTVGKPANALPQKPGEPWNPITNPTKPAKIYNQMIAPLPPYGIKGVIWYQGESNSPRAEQYKTLFPALIKSWRELWNRDLPFYFVQVAPHVVVSPDVRDAQLYTYKNVNNTGITVITDAADSLDIHPRNKEIVGKRLAAWALVKTYHQSSIDYSGPIYEKMETQGDKVKIYFKFAKGLNAQNGALKEFTIAGADKKFVPATATIDGDAIIVSSPDVTQPVAVRFAWKFVPRPNLFNAANLPASPFRTDNW